MPRSLLMLHSTSLNFKKFHNEATNLSPFSDELSEAQSDLALVIMLVNGREDSNPSCLTLNSIHLTFTLYSQLHHLLNAMCQELC